MADQEQVVDSTQSEGAVDTATDPVEIPSAEESSPKKYTEAELDARIKARIDKQRAKHEAEVDELRKRNEEMTERLAAYEAAEAHEKTRVEVAAEFGVDASMLDGETEGEIRAQARALSSVPNFHPFRDSGEQKQAAPTRESIIAIQNERERLQAIREHPELFK